VTTQDPLVEEPVAGPADTGAEATAELARALPALRSSPGCPTGSDRDLLTMSQAPAYTACPNPFIADWLSGGKAHTDGAAEEGERARRGPFAADISEGKGHPIYKAHSFPTKVPHGAIMRYLLHYTEPGDVVLDGFCGSGMTGVAAQACGAPDLDVKAAIGREFGAVRWGPRRAILQDLSPSATFIAAGLNLPIDARAFERRSREILERFGIEYGWMYQTRLNGGQAANIDFTVWSEVLTCPHCGGEVVFYDTAFDQATGKVRERFPCPGCGANSTKDVLTRRRTPVKTLAGDTINRVEFRPVAIHWRTGGARGVKTPGAEDTAVLRRVAGLRLPPFPTADLPLAQMTHGSRLGPKGFTKVHHLWSDRALASLAVLWDLCAAEQDPTLRLALLFWMEQGLWGFSWMNRFVPRHYSHVNQFLNGVYYVSSLHAEPSPRYNLGGSSGARGKRATLVKTWAASPARQGQVMISTGSSTALSVPDASVDYIFVDPPFGENIPYADLALVVEHWHRVLTAVPEEAIVDKARHKGLPEYQELMRRCFAEFHRVLKPGRWMTVEFSNSSNDVWQAIQHALSMAGFVVADTRVFDKEQLSYRQVTATNAVKRDLIISAYRPATELEERFEVAAGSEEGAWAFVKEHLRHLPVTNGQRGRVQPVRERYADRLFDRVTAFHVNHGVMVPLSASEFYAGLDRRFALRDGMYFLPDQVETYERHRMTFKDLAETSLFITEEATAVQWLRQKLKAKPRPYAEIMPEYFAEVQTGTADWEALPELIELLQANFVLVDGRWQVPDPKDAAHLEQLRTRELLAEFARYTEGRGRLQRFRSEAVRAGFREAWGNKDFHLIVSVGRRLPPDALTEDQAISHYFRAAERLAH